MGRLFLRVSFSTIKIWRLKRVNHIKSHGAICWWVLVLILVTFLSYEKVCFPRRFNSTNTLQSDVYYNFTIKLMGFLRWNFNWQEFRKKAQRNMVKLGRDAKREFRMSREGSGLQPAVDFELFGFFFIIYSVISETI